MTLHIFNPSHDEALAINSSKYCPSKAARTIGERYWDIARLWMAPDDFILHLPVDGSLRGVVTPDWEQVTAIEPWGWDPHVTGLLQRLGAPERLLPSPQQLERIRVLSSRHTAVQLVARLAETLRQYPLPGVLIPQNSWCETEEEVLAAIKTYESCAILKQPWSCSGRGVWRSESPSSLSRIRKTLREQGAVEVEPLYHRTADFAMEFMASTDSATGRCCIVFEGLSLFETHDGGYLGNVIAPQSELMSRLGLSASLINSLAQTVAQHLADLLATDYSGPLGIDMMLTPEGIHPCIEINLRNTMGRVAIFQARQSTHQA